MRPWMKKNPEMSRMILDQILPVINCKLADLLPEHKDLFIPVDKEKWLSDEIIRKVSNAGKVAELNRITEEAYAMMETKIREIEDR